MKGNLLNHQKVSKYYEHGCCIFPAVTLDPFFNRNLEKLKIIGLKLHNEKFDTNIALNVESKKVIYWGIDNIFESFAPLNIPDPNITTYTDASLTG